MIYDVFDCLADEPVPRTDCNTLDEALSIAFSMGNGYIARAKPESIIKVVEHKTVSKPVQEIKKPIAQSGEFDFF